MRKQGKVDKIEETVDDNTETENESEAKNGKYCLLMTNVEDAALMYKFAGTVISSQKSSNFTTFR